MFSSNFHTFVLISTLVYYIILRKSQKIERFNKQYILYILYFPVVLYSCHYFFNTSPATVLTPVSTSTVIPSDDLLSRPYPESMSV